MKDFIRDSSSSSSADDEEDKEFDPAEFYPKVNRLIDQDLSSDESSETSSAESDDQSSSTTKKKPGKMSVTFLESLSNYVPLEDKHSDAKQFVVYFI